jgi:hypothetical protein
MTDNFSKEYKKWIEDLSEEHFNQLILNYSKEYFDTKDVFLSNGPYDGGLDLIVNKNGTQVKRSIQISVQNKGFEKKLLDDIKKAKNNQLKFGYENKLDFYYSLSISPNKKNELIRTADIEYGINLSIFDSNRIAELASSFSSIIDFLYDIKNSAFKGSSSKVDKNSKILYDTLSMGTSSLYLKNSFIQAFILSFLYENPNSNSEEVMKYLVSVLSNEKKHIYENEIGKLVLDGVIEINFKDEKKVYQLTESTHVKIQLIDKKTEIEEIELKTEIEKILIKYKLKEQVDEIFSLLKQLYDESFNFSQDEVDTINNGYNRTVNKIFKDFINQLIKNDTVDNKTANDIGRELLVICSKNEYLSKSGSSKLLTNLYKSNKLESYLSKSNKLLFLDTQILLQLICREYSSEEINDPLFNAVDVMFSSIDSTSIPIQCCTTIDYVGEVAGHLKEAYDLQRFLELDYIVSLGPSKNVFFNYYLYLKESHEFEDFNAFLEDLLDIDYTVFENKSDFEIVIYKLKECFEFINIEVYSPRGYPPEEYATYRKKYENCLSFSSQKIPSHGNRSFEARRNDLNALLTICDFNYDEEDDHEDPYLITWDTSFYQTRSVFEKIDGFSSFQLMPPLKFANCIGLIDFKINPNAVNYNIISMVEDNFNLSNDKISFIDLLNSFIEKKELSKWKLGKKFAKLRDELMNGTSIEEFDKVKNDNIPIDEFLILIQRNYKNPEEKYNFSDIIELFSDNNYSDKIIGLIQINIAHFKQGNNLKPSIIQALNELIKERK